MWGNGTYTVGYINYGHLRDRPRHVKTPMGTVSGTDSEEYTLTKITDDSCGK